MGGGPISRKKYYITLECPLKQACSSRLTQFFLWQAFATLNPEMKPLLDGCQTNRDQWALLASNSRGQTDGAKGRTRMEEGGGEERTRMVEGGGEGRTRMEEGGGEGRTRMEEGGEENAHNNHIDVPTMEKTDVVATR